MASRRFINSTRSEASETSSSRWLTSSRRRSASPRSPSRAAPSAAARNSLRSLTSSTSPARSEKIVLDTPHSGSPGIALCAATDSPPTITAATAAAPVTACHRAGRLPWWCELEVAEPRRGHRRETLGAIATSISSALGSAGSSAAPVSARQSASSAARASSSSSDRSPAPRRSRSSSSWATSAGSTSCAPSEASSSRVPGSTSSSFIAIAPLHPSRSLRGAASSPGVGRRARLRPCCRRSPRFPPRRARPRLVAGRSPVASPAGSPRGL